MLHLRHRSSGFTLLELLIVITIIAIGSAGAVFALRDSDATSLEREADRLSAVLEAGRAQSRSTGVALVWLPLSDGYALLTAPELAAAAARARQSGDGAWRVSPEQLQSWLGEGTSASVSSSGTTQDSASAVITLGPEPMLAAQSLILRRGQQQLRIASDGLRPFRLQAQAPDTAPQ